ncbi:hypothetical protein FRC96_08285 [Lujinxingia vulgaris]|uniref:Uncharacterized protein n=1 Tax=Lujinxingia vulgaris TaxID=2600176 RepID=A0A5C6X6E9_9DELT|nr:hypothetical protein [Lujinxingia vulgaris]TXD37403.1 hypothetical protein FRC96_08285 [Lujinxingia vulgaris]
MSSPAFFARRVAITLLLALTLSPALLACKSTSTSPDKTPPPIEVTGPEDLVQTEDTLLSYRVRPGGELPEAIRKISFHPMLAFAADALDDPVDVLLDLPDGSLGALDRSRPLFFNVSSLGNEDFLQAVELGLPLREHEWPSFILTRWLLPTDDPAKLASQIDSHYAPELAASPDDAVVLRSFEGPGFLRVEVALPITTQHLPAREHHSRAQAWIDALDLASLPAPSIAAYRPTAAYNAYTKGTSEMAIWTRFDALARIASLNNAFLIARQADVRTMAPKHRLETHRRLAFPSVINDPLVAENEDIALLLSATEEGAILFDIVTTPTAAGVRLRDDLSPGQALGPLGITPFLHVDASLLGVSPDDRDLKMFWTLNDIIGRQEDATLPTPDTLPMTNGEGLLLGLLAAGHHPMTSMHRVRQTLASAMTAPLPQTVSMRAFHLPDVSPMPVGAAALLTFENTPEVRAAIEQTLEILRSQNTFLLDAEIRDVTEQIEVRLSLGESAETRVRNADTRPSEGTHMAFEAAHLGELRALAPRGFFDIFNRISLTAQTHDNVWSLRLALNAPPDLPALDLASDVPLLPTPTSRCRTELAAAAFTHLNDLSVDGSAKVERYLETYAERAERCLGPDHPYAAEAEARLNLVRQWAAELGEDPSLSASAQ